MKIILLHGALGCAEDLSPLAKQLEKMDIATDTFEFSGHGKKAFAQDFSISEFARELENFLTQQKSNKIVLFGYSMGGFVILETLSKNQSLNFPFITLATKWQWTEEIAEKEAQMCSKAFLIEKAPAFYADLKSKNKQIDVLLEKTASLIKSLGNGQRPDVKLITSKATILVGELDKMVNQNESKELQQLLPNAKFEILPTTKHPLNTVDMELLAEKIKSFVATLD